MRTFNISKSGKLPSARIMPTQIFNDVNFRSEPKEDFINILTNMKKKKISGS